MKKYLLTESGTFYKANLHCHTTVSDGRMSPEEVKKVYMEQGYSVIAYTDHDVLIAHPELKDDNFLPLEGYEMEVNEPIEGEFRYKKTCHMCFVALKPGTKQVCFHRSKFIPNCVKDYVDKVNFDENEPDYEREYTHEGISDMMKKGREGGFFVTYNHPSWSMENYSDYIGYNNMHAMEICNYSCQVGGYCDYNEKEYDDMLRAGKKIFCIAADDNHGEADCCGGFTMIKAEKLEYEAITSALAAGNFYASEGPEIHQLWFEDGKLHITCSDAEKIIMHTSSRRNGKAYATDTEMLNGAEFEVLPEDVYVRVTVIDSKGRHANTNAYFTDELFK